MKVMLTSFGVEHSLSSQSGPGTMFQRMPPVSFRGSNETFLPDYELLLLCDSVIMDETSFDRLVHSSVPAYLRVSETFQVLKSEGRVELKDFSSILRPHVGLLDRMIEHDLKSLDQWVIPLRESLNLWRHFLHKSTELFRTDREAWQDQFPFRAVRPDEIHFTRVLVDEAHSRMELHLDQMDDTSVMVYEALESSKKRKRKEYRRALRDVLRRYLTYVDANLILSHQFDVGFHDWLDLAPFYATKLLSVGQDEDPVAKSRAQLERLFTIPFPDFALRNTRALIKALNDKRIEDLRRLVSEAVAGHVQFDNEFAKSVLREVFRSSERAKHWRSVVGYATLPIGLIPSVGTPVQKIVEESVSIPIEKKLKRTHRWFYMLSDIAEASKGSTEHEL